MKLRDSKREAEAFYEPDPDLQVAMDAAWELGMPLLISGEPGTGKTQAAYYAAKRWSLGEVLYFQVKSDSTAHDLLYHFDAVSYFREAHLAAQERSGKASKVSPGSPSRVDKKAFLEERALWTAFKDSKNGKRRVILVDEIDKAPRDFPNDLLHELDQHQFEIRELPQDHPDKRIRSDPQFPPVIFITTNSERRLPDPFLRRCVYHHLEFNSELLKKIVERRRREEFPKLSNKILSTALQCFLGLRARGSRPPPSTAEYLCWLRMVSHAAQTTPEVLQKLDPSRLSALPFKGLLLKTASLQRELRSSS